MCGRMDLQQPAHSACLMFWQQCQLYDSFQVNWVLSSLVVINSQRMYDSGLLIVPSLCAVRAILSFIFMKQSTYVQYLYVAELNTFFIQLEIIFN